MLKEEVILKGRPTQDLYKIPLPKNCGILSTFLFCRMGLTSSLGGLEGLDEAMCNVAGAVPATAGTSHVMVLFCFGKRQI